MVWYYRDGLYYLARQTVASPVRFRGIGNMPAWWAWPRLGVTVLRFIARADICGAPVLLRQRQGLDSITVANANRPCVHSPPTHGLDGASLLAIQRQPRTLVSYCHQVSIKHIRDLRHRNMAPTENGPQTRIRSYLLLVDCVLQALVLDVDPKLGNSFLPGLRLGAYDCRECQTCPYQLSARARARKSVARRCPIIFLNVLSF